MQVIPTNPSPSQSLTVQLGGQPCTINLRTYLTGLFVDLYVNNAAIITGVIAENANRIVRDAYLGFVGDLAFFDTQPDPVNGPQDPEYSGLGSRWFLAYLTPADLAADGFTG